MRWANISLRIGRKRMVMTITNAKCVSECWISINFSNFFKTMIFRSITHFAKQRPISPINMYQVQLTSAMSITHRITGIGATVALYGGILLGSYANVKGIPVSQYFQELAVATPALIYYPIKLGLAGSFSYHTFNGIRHMLWDGIMFLNLDGVYKTGYAVLGATAVTTLLLLLQ
eukprot:NODE_379_length_8451_cov_0.593630.p6 type:complete len:174 gc:universal NODE_379_length_8451_cov_0.593630:7590-7069(-)